MKVRTARDSRRSAGVSPAVGGASRSRSEQALTSEEIETEGEAHDGAGRMPAPQRARRPRYILRIPSHFHVARAIRGSRLFSQAEFVILKSHKLQLEKENLSNASVSISNVATGLPRHPENGGVKPPLRYRD